MKTWHKEMAVVAAILVLVNLFTNKLFSIEILSAIAVLLTFGHVQISIRLTEQEEKRAQPQVSCYYKLLYYYIGKETFWFIYFFLNKSYSALVGVIVFLLYPVWRKYHKHGKQNTLP